MVRYELNSRDPIYLQLIEHVRLEIISGNIKPGEELPSRRQIAKDFGINPNTVQRAFSEMEERGWIYTEPYKPSRLTEDTEVLSDIKNAFLQKTIKEFVESIKALDVDRDTVVTLITQAFENGGDTDD